MNILIPLCVAVTALLCCNSAWAEPVKVSAPDGCPTYIHTSQVAVARGTPSVISVKMECAVGMVTGAKIFVRLAEAGKPIEIEMTDKGNGLYEATIPVSMYEGIHSFWYYIDGYGKSTPDQVEPGLAESEWFRVNILDLPLLDEESKRRGLIWLGVGAGAVVGAAFIADNNDDDNDGSPPPKSNVSAPKDDNGDDEEEEEDGDDDKPGPISVPPVVPPPPSSSSDPGPPTPPPPCTSTGSESVSLANTAPCETPPISIFICNTCTNVTISATGSWGDFVSAPNYNGSGCSSDGAPALLLPKPLENAGLKFNRAGVDSYTITIQAGSWQTVIPWPSQADLDDCL